jgi:hypothetical protein
MASSNGNRTKMSSHYTKNRTLSHHIRKDVLFNFEKRQTERRKKKELFRVCVCVEMRGKKSRDRKIDKRRDA